MRGALWSCGQGGSGWDRTPGNRRRGGEPKKNSWGKGNQLPQMVEFAFSKQPGMGGGGGVEIEGGQEGYPKRKDEGNSLTHSVMIDVKKKLSERNGCWVSEKRSIVPVNKKGEISPVFRGGGQWEKGKQQRMKMGHQKKHPKSKQGFCGEDEKGEKEGTFKKQG